MATPLRYISDECWVIPTGPNDDPTSRSVVDAEPFAEHQRVSEGQPSTPSAARAERPSAREEATATALAQAGREALKHGEMIGPPSSGRPNRRRQKRVWLKLGRLASWLPLGKPKGAARPTATEPATTNDASAGLVQCVGDAAVSEAAGQVSAPAGEASPLNKPQQRQPAAPGAKASRVLRRKYKHSRAKEASRRVREDLRRERRLRKTKDLLGADLPKFEPQAGHGLRWEAQRSEPLAQLDERINLQLDMAHALRADERYLAAKGRSRRPVAVVEITNKVIGDFFYLRPDDAVSDLICGVLGRALELTGAGLVALHVLSNHVGMLVTVHSCSQLASLMHRFNQQTSHRIGRHLNLPTRLWAGRYKAVVLTGDAGTQLHRLRYCLANGTKENLVAHPSQWPGVHSARSFCNGEVLAGTWTNFTSYGRALSRDPSTRIEDHQTRYVLKHSKLPCFEHLSDADYKALTIWQCHDIAREAKLARRRLKGLPPAGPEALRRVPLDFRPENPARSPRPAVHSVDPAASRRFKAAYKNYVAHHQALRASLVVGLKVLGVDFAGGILPTGWEPTDPAAVVAPPTMAISEVVAVT